MRCRVPSRDGYASGCRLCCPPLSGHGSHCHALGGGAQTIEDAGQGAEVDTLRDLGKRSITVEASTRPSCNTQPSLGLSTATAATAPPAQTCDPQQFLRNGLQRFLISAHSSPGSAPASARHPLPEVSTGIHMCMWGQPAHTREPSRLLPPPQGIQLHVQVPWRGRAVPRGAESQSLPGLLRSREA